MRILLVEDHGDIAEPLVEALRLDRYEVVWVRDEASASDTLASSHVDLAILDVMLQDGDDAGFELAAGLREAGFAGQILFISARDAEVDRVHGLDLGGDDYLVKPFGLPEFRARVRALLRRRAQTRRTVLDRSPLRVDFRARRVQWGSREVHLTAREFEMLELFAHYPERAFTVDELLQRFFPEAGSGRGVVRVYVSQLRQKVAADVIRTVAGGYRLGPS